MHQILDDELDPNKNTSLFEPEKSKSDQETLKKNEKE